MAKVVGDIAVEVGANVVPFERGMQRAGRSTKGFEKQFALSSRNVKRAAAGMAVAAVAAVAAFAKVASSALEAAEGIADIANKSGASVRGLQRLRFAADQNGASARDMDDALTRLTRRMSLFATDGGGPAAKAIEALNLNVRNADGSLRASDEVFAEIAARFQTLEDSAQKAALASQLFGEDAGPRLVPLLSQGQAGLKAFGDEAERLGIVLDDAAVAKAAEANAQLRALGQSLTGTLQGAVLDNVEAIEALATGLAAVIGVIGQAVGAVTRFADELARTATNIRDVLSGAANVPASVDLRDPSNRGVLPPPDQRPPVQGPAFPGAVQGPNLPEPAPLGFGDTIVAGGVTIGPVPTFGQGVANTPGGFGQFVNPFTPPGFEGGGTVPGIDGGGGGGAASAIQEQADEALRIYQETLEQVKQIQSDTLSDQLGGWGDFFGDLGSMMGSEGEKMLKIQKSLNAGQALMNAWTAYTQTLADPSLPWFAKFAAASKVLAAGVGAVNAIKSVGSGGTGATSAGAAGGTAAAAPAQAPLDVRLSGLSPDTIVNGASIGDLLDRITEEAGDRGYRILVAS